VEEYRNLIPAVGIRQLNLNLNPHSTIYSYLNFASFLSSNKNIDIPYSYLKLNNPLNECKYCKGLGVLHAIDSSLALNENLSIKDIPFVAWQKKYNTGSNLYENLLILFCEKYNISINKTLKELSKDEKKLLFYNNENVDIFQVKFKANNRYRNRKVSFVGYFVWLEKFLYSSKKSEYNFAQKFAFEQVCKYCRGSRIDGNRYNDVKIDRIGFIDFVANPIKDIIQYIDRIKYKNIYDKLHNIISLGIGYLSLSRSIPTLSGGELQKLNLANLINSNMSNILIVIDEITSGLNISDYDNILYYINQMKKTNNTVILIEHSKYFLSKCDILIKVGPKSGKDGGYLVEASLEQNKFKFIEKEQTFDDFVQVNNININNIKNQSLHFPIKAITSIIGKSGSGKSSLAVFLEKTLDDVVYISQKSLKGNIRSTLASILEINKYIAKSFAKKYDKDYQFFMPNSDREIVCKNCKGQGVVKYERGFEESIIITCPECDGGLFNEKAKKYEIDKFSIHDIYNFTIDDLSSISSISKFQDFFKLTSSLALSHLSLNRKTNTLSGGELKRVKLLKILFNKSLKNKILIIDEPSAGLDEKSSSKILEVINNYKDKTKAIILIEHNPYIFLKTSFIIEVGPNAGYDGGKIIFCDDTNNYYTSYFDNYRNFIY
jgi:excinuclease UvrABC ATPase subunit